AQRGDVLRLVLRQASVLLGAGIVLGVVGAYFASSLLRGFLYSVEAHDVLTIAGVAFLLATCGLLASYIPARRAASIDPMQALRSE
ncbi:MAG: FtsX-like permease family protein, partial [Acidobacteriaceae bacterium]